MDLQRFCDPLEGPSSLQETPAMVEQYLQDAVLVRNELRLVAFTRPEQNAESYCHASGV